MMCRKLYHFVSTMCGGGTLISYLPRTRYSVTLRAFFDVMAGYQLGGSYNIAFCYSYGRTGISLRLGK